MKTTKILAFMLMLISSIAKANNSYIDDVKSFVTVFFTIALVALLFIAAFKSEAMFETVFILFTNVCTAVFTYYFTKKDNKEN